MFKPVLVFIIQFKFPLKLSSTATDCEDLVQDSSSLDHLYGCIYLFTLKYMQRDDTQ